MGAGFIPYTVVSRYFQIVGAASSRDLPYPASTHNRGWKPLPLIINFDPNIQLFVIRWAGSEFNSIRDLARRIKISED
jgi:hypothetical protein